MAHTRRTILGTVAMTAGLAGCLDGGAGDPPTETPTPTPTDTPTEGGGGGLY